MSFPQAGNALVSCDHWQQGCSCCWELPWTQLMLLSLFPIPSSQKDVKAPSLGQKLMLFMAMILLFALLHTKIVRMASAMHGLTAGAELCWELLSRKGIFLQRNNLSSNMKFKMELGLFCDPAVSLSRAGWACPGVLSSQMSLEGESSGWSPRIPAVPSPRQGCASWAQLRLCQVKLSCVP